MSFSEIRSLLPHAGPMVLLDRVVSSDEQALCAEVRISEDSLFYSDAAGGVGSWVGVEYMAQAIGAHAGWQAQLAGRAIRIGFLLGARKYSARVSEFAAGSVLLVRAQHVLRGENGLSAFDCSIALAGEPGAEPLATATLTVFEPDDVDTFLQETANGTGQ